MTEEQWLASINPRGMVEYVRGAAIEVRTRWQGRMAARRFTVSERKLRLIAVGCCTKVIDLLPGTAHRRLLKLAEERAEREVEPGRLAKALQRATLEWAEFREDHFAAPELWATGEACEAVLLATSGSTAQLAEVFDHVLRAFHPLSASAIERERAEMADLVREVLGNPFRFEPMKDAWRTADGGAVVRLAQTIYDERTFHDLPVLADALFDAGCDNEALLDHCRTGGRHVRGCWALDRVLGLE